MKLNRYFRAPYLIFTIFTIRLNIIQVLLPDGQEWPKLPWSHLNSYSGPETFAIYTLYINELGYSLDELQMITGQVLLNVKALNAMQVFSSKLNVNCGEGKQLILK